VINPLQLALQQAQVYLCPCLQAAVDCEACQGVEPGCLVTELLVAYTLLLITAGEDAFLLLSMVLRIVEIG
jgi:hypothetical protein